MIETKMQVVYSQGPEQAIILKNISAIKNGRVLEIGANDGKTNSNSLALIERGWSALLIEPSPFAFQKLLALHWNNPQVTLLNAAIGPDTRIVRFWEAEDSQYSTTLESQMKTWAARGIKFRDYWVSQVTMATVQNQLGACAHVLSIDTEGSSFDILTQCPIGAWDTQIIVIEHDGREIEISGWARDNGFEACGLTAENLLLMRKS